MNNCGITGHSGVLGEYLKKKLKYRFIKFNGDIKNANQVEKWVSKNKFDYFIHLAAIVPTALVEKNYSKAKKVNCDGTRNLINALIKHKKKLKNFFFASTSHVYGPKSKYIKLKENSQTKTYTKYGKTKLIAEKFLEKKFKKNKINFCIGRIFSFTHKKQNLYFVVPSLYSKIKKSKKKELHLQNLNHYRDFISIEDLSRAIDIILRKKVSGIINIGTGKKINLSKIASFFCRKYSVKLKIRSNKNPTYLIADNTRLKKTGWKIKKDFIRELDNFE